MDMQRLLTAALVLLAVAFSAGGVAFSVRADSQHSSAAVAAKAPAQDRCSVTTQAQVIHVNAEAARLAAQDDMVPLNTQGYNYNAYDDQWRPEAPTAAPAGSAPAVPAAPAKP